MNWPAYDQIQDSGIKWLGQVPTHWIVDRLKRSVAFSQNGIWGAEPDGGIDDIRCVRVADFDRPRLRIHDKDITYRKVTDSERKGRILNTNDLILEKSGGGENNPVGFVVLYDRAEPAVTSNFVARVALQPGLDPRFWTYLHNWLYASRLTQPSIKQTSGIQNLDQQSYLDERVAFPPLREQSEIADFLDCETAKVDALIGKQQQLIATLREDRTATIAHAVTKGLDRNAEMTDSGTKWLGSIPANWSVPQLGMHATVGNGATPSRENPEYWTDGAVPWLNSSHVNRPEITDADQFITERASKECHLPLVRSGSILVGLTGQGKTRGMASILQIESTISQHLAYLSPSTPALDARFLFRVINSAYQLLRDLSDENGSTKGGLTCAALRNLRIPLPPLEEQVQIAAFLDERCVKIDALIAKATEMIEILREYRSALIAAAVTGKIDVREAAY